MNPEKIMSGISKEIMASLKAMGKASTTEEKLKYSKIIKNLCKSMDVFFDFMNNIDPYDDDENDNGPIPF